MLRKWWDSCWPFEDGQWLVRQKGGLEGIPDGARIKAKAWRRQMAHALQGRATGVRAERAYGEVVVGHCDG